MLKLHGFALSNYYNVVKTALLEKGIEYEAVEARPSQDEGYLARSPMGKVPCIETDQGFLAETHVILDYLEDAYPQTPLLPADAWERAQVRQLVHSLELYIELPARKGIAAAFGREVKDHVKTTMTRELPQGITAVSRLTKFSPWIAGGEFTYADIFGYHALTLANMLAKTNIDLDLIDKIPGAKAWYETMSERETIKSVMADQAAARAAMAR